jgi:hypothetical protein
MVRLMHYLMGEDWAHAEFAASIGAAPLKADQQFNLDPEAEQAFLNVYTGEMVRWATRTHWGEDELTPSIQAAIDRFPRKQ